MRRNLRLDFSKIKSPIPGWKLDFSEKKHAAHFAIRLFISAECFRILRQHSTTLGIGFAIRNCNPQPLGMVFCLRKTNSKTSRMVSHPKIPFLKLERSSLEAEKQMDREDLFATYFFIIQIYTIFVSSEKTINQLRAVNK